MIKLIDFTGKTIVLGDIVITISGFYKNLCMGKVTKICEKKILIKYDHNGIYKYPKEVVVWTNELNSL